MNKHIKLASLALAGAMMTSTASAEMQWSDFSLSYLYGTNYEFTPNGKMDVVTLEHTSGQSWGDTFLFYDRTMPDSGSSSFYAELSPRFSIGKLTNSDMSFGPINDVLVATTWEAGNGFDNYLVGAGVSLTVPGFKYFNVNLYQANNELSDNDQQLSLSWGAPFSVASQDFLIDGFLDWSTASDTNKSEMNFTPQIKWNAGKILSLKSPLYVGVEYAYWNNKYGSDVDERVASLLVKWHL